MLDGLYVNPLRPAVWDFIPRHVAAQIDAIHFIVGAVDRFVVPGGNQDLLARVKHVEIIPGDGDRMSRIAEPLGIDEYAIRTGGHLHPLRLLQKRIDHTEAHFVIGPPGLSLKEDVVSHVHLDHRPVSLRDTAQKVLVRGVNHDAVYLLVRLVSCDADQVFGPGRR